MRDRTAKMSPGWQPSGTRNSEATEQQRWRLAPWLPGRPSGSVRSRTPRASAGGSRARGLSVRLAPPPEAAPAVGSGMGARLPSRGRRDVPDPRGRRWPPEGTRTPLSAPLPPTPRTSGVI